MPDTPDRDGPPARRPGPPAPPRHQVRLPGFLVQRETGLGDAVSRATAIARIRPCGGCRRRAATLNGWLGIAPRGHRATTHGEP